MLFLGGRGVCVLGGVCLCCSWGRRGVYVLFLGGVVCVCVLGVRGVTFLGGQTGPNRAKRPKPSQ